VLLEFADLDCPSCRYFYTHTLPEIRLRYIGTGKLRYVAADLPLPIHPGADAAANASHCAAAQGHYWDFVTFAYGPAFPLSPTSIANALPGNPDHDRYAACVEAAAKRAVVESGIEAARSARITGTPGFVVGTMKGTTLHGVRIPGAAGPKALISAIDAAVGGPR
jgi:protein-disulfide isomerase